jgi:hypothetical protein
MGVGGHEYKIYNNGDVEGFPEGAIVFNHCGELVRSDLQRLPATLCKDIAAHNSRVLREAVERSKKIGQTTINTDDVPMLRDERGLTPLEPLFTASQNVANLWTPRNSPDDSAGTLPVEAQSP